MEISLEPQERERAWLQALERQDVNALGEILHEDFRSTSAHGDVIRKSTYLAAALQQKVCESEMLEFSVQQTNHVAIVKARLKCKSQLQGREFADDLLITDVWLRDVEGGQWKALSRHASRAPERAVSSGVRSIQDHGLLTRTLE